MARYIDVDNLIDYLTKPTGHKATCDGCCDIDCVDCIRDEVIKNLPTADVVEVVRCKDCKYYDGFYSHRCTNTDLVDSDDCYARIDFAEDDFCSYGERRTG